MNKQNRLKLTEGKVLTNPRWALGVLAANPNECDLVDFQKRLLKWIRLLTDKGVSIPKSVTKPYLYLLPDAEIPNADAPPNPRIVGLVVETDPGNNENIGFVIPLLVNHSQCGWRVSHTLPFQAGHIQDSLYRLLSESGISIKERVPELVGFSIDDQFNELPTGTSMHIAGMMAVIDAFNGKTSELFRAVCAIVKPVEDKLEPVNSIKEKLTSFIRECGHGSLLIRHKSCVDGKKWDSYFKDVWEVNSFADLACKLIESKQLNGVLNSYSIDKNSIETAQTRIRWLRDESKILKALEFIERIEKAAYANGKPLLRVGHAIQTQLEELNRHLGRCDKAIEHSSNAVKELENLKELSSYQEILEAKVRLGAAYFDGHQFRQAYELLHPLTQEVETNPQLVPAEARFMLYNTLGRVMFVLGANPCEWKKWFERSIDLQEIVDPESIFRTRCYLIHGLLRHDILDEAEKELQKANESVSDLYSETFINFYRADYQRRMGTKEWTNIEFEQPGKHVGGHPFGFYLQATARQLGQTDEERASRFGRAADEFEKDAGQSEDLNILQLFASFMRLSAAIIRSDQGEVEKIHASVLHFLNRKNAEALRDYYQELLPNPIGAREEMEKVLLAVPYF